MRLFPNWLPQSRNPCRFIPFAVVSSSGAYIIVTRWNRSQIVMYERDTSTGVLFSEETETELNDETDIGAGRIVGMTHSTNKVFVSMAASPADSHIVVLDLVCDPTPSPTVSPTRAPTLYPSRAPTPTPTRAGEVAERCYRTVHCLARHPPPPKRGATCGVCMSRWVFRSRLGITTRNPHVCTREHPRFERLNSSLTVAPVRCDDFSLPVCLLPGIDHVPSSASTVTPSAASPPTAVPTPSAPTPGEKQNETRLNSRQISMFFALVLSA